jgi:hypothetical protein
LLAAADIEYYSFNNRRITLDLFLLVKEVDFTLWDLIHKYWFLILLYLLTVAVILTADIRLNRFKKIPRLRNYIFHAVLLILVTGLTFFLGRGGIKGKPLSAINGSDYASFEKTSLVTNSPFVFLHPSAKKPTGKLFYRRKCGLLYHHTNYKNSLENKNMNVVFIIRKNLSADFIGCLNNYPAIPLSGQPD